MPLPTLLYWKPTIKSIGGKRRRSWAKANNFVLSGRNRNNAHELRDTLLYIKTMRIDLRSLQMSRKRKLYRARYLRKVQQRLVMMQLQELTTKLDLMNAELEATLRDPKNDRQLATHENP